MSLSAFDKLYGAFEVRHQVRLSTSQATQRHGTQRQRAAGGGAPHRYDLRARWLMTLVWLPVYTPYNAMGPPNFSGL
ncbi:MAG: hypothetical protein U0350_01710 [Caldilineaceae bacterium]